MLNFKTWGIKAATIPLLTYWEEISCSQPTVWPVDQQEGTNSSQSTQWFLDSGQSPYWSPEKTRRYNITHGTNCGRNGFLTFLYYLYASTRHDKKNKIILINLLTLWRNKQLHWKIRDLPSCSPCDSVSLLLSLLHQGCYQLRKGSFLEMLTMAI